MAKPFNGHESWNAWNVSLWIANDEPLYRAAMDALQRPHTDGKPASVQCATARFLNATGLEGRRTPDGARYSFRSTKLAIASLME